MKFNLVLAVLALILNPMSQALADKGGDDLVIEFTTTDGLSDDCKISLNEIPSGDAAGFSINLKVCTAIPVISPNEEEATPQSIAVLQKLESEGKGALAISYDGKAETDVLELLTEWEGFLEKKGLIKAADWNASVVSKEGAVVTLRYDNSVTGESITFPVTLDVK